VKSLVSVHLLEKWCHFVSPKALSKSKIRHYRSNVFPSKCSRSKFHCCD